MSNIVFLDETTGKATAFQTKQLTREYSYDNFTNSTVANWSVCLETDDAEAVYQGCFLGRKTKIYISTDPPMNMEVIVTSMEGTVDNKILIKWQERS